VRRYWYLASSLPGLLFGAPPPLSSQEFVGFCKRLMKPKEYREVESVPYYLAGIKASPSHSGGIDNQFSGAENHAKDSDSNSRSADTSQGLPVIQSAFLESFLVWERGFKNELSRLRARASGKNEDAYIRTGGQSDEAVKAAAVCFATDDPLKAEMGIEKERWAAVERLSALSGFDMDFLIAYRIKLLINERLQGLVAEKGKLSYKRLYTEIFGAAEQQAAVDTSGERA